VIASLKVWGPRSALGLSVALAGVAADQLHKWWMIDVYGIGEKGRVAVLPFLDLVGTLNSGISYGLLPLGASGQYLLAGIAVLASIGFVLWLAHAGSRLGATSIGLIVAGALGNAIDRVHLGGVADFFSLHAFGYYWYIFNVADVWIVAGVIGLLYETLLANRKSAAV
jgi:signal peptidase II